MYPCYDQFTFLITFDEKASECTRSNQDNNKTEMRGTQNYHPNHGRAKVPECQTESGAKKMNAERKDIQLGT